MFRARIFLSAQKTTLQRFTIPSLQKKLISTNKNKTVLITGASSGIGECCARKFASQGFDLILVARRRHKIQMLEEELCLANKNISITTSFLDVRNKQDISELCNQIKSRNKSVDVLVNNAGLVLGLDSLELTKTEDVQTMFDTNVMGCIHFMQSIIPMMKSKGSGHIINMGSIAGKQAYKNGSIYCATKSALLSITNSIRYELMDTNIKVSSINPGLVQTEFSKIRFGGNEEKAKNVYRGIKPLEAEDIADIVVFVACAPKHVVLSDIVVYPVGQADATSVYRNYEQ